MVLTKPDGSAWTLEGGERKLSLRAGLPGARVFDACAESLRAAKGLGLSTADRLPLALPASWCVNSPADSRVLRRWALPPLCDVWVALADVLDEPLDEQARASVAAALPVLAPQPTGIEAVSKVLALLVPDAVPLMPEPAVAFLLGGAPPRDAARVFLDVVEWFARAAADAREPLAAWAAAHREVPLSPAQVLDRLLWFDSEGHRHWKGEK